MSEVRTRKLLDCWAPPEWAGAPIGCITTTFTFDAVLFEEECLARFLSLDNDPNEADVLYLIEREEKLASLRCAAALVDSRQARCRRSLRWDVLPVRLPRGGTQHAKISLLVWENLIRAIVASANLSESGYLRNQEVFGVLDCPLGSEGPVGTLNAVIDFLDEVVGLTALSNGSLGAAAERCRGLLGDARVRARGVLQPKSGAAQPDFIGLIPGNRSVLDQVIEAWPGKRAPDQVDILSPYFDLDSSNAPAQAVWGILRQRRAAALSIHTSGEQRPADQGLVLHAPESIKSATPPEAAYTTHFHQVAEADLPSDNGPLFRPLHAKSIRLSNKRWRALLIGSSNFTSAGLGLGPVVNVEANLYYVADAARNEEAASALDAAFLQGEPLEESEILMWKPHEEQEEDSGETAPALPAGFEDAELFSEGGSAYLKLEFGPDLPPGWWVRGEESAQVLVAEPLWAARNRPSDMVVKWTQSRPPAGLEVGWDGTAVPAWWPVNVRDNLALPPVEELASLSLDALIEILTSARPLVEIMRRLLRRRTHEASNDYQDPILDPHRRVDTSAFLLNRARRASWAITGLCEKLAQPVATRSALEWRLHSPVGADALVDALHKEGASDDERTFLLGELALALSNIEPETRPGALSVDEVQTAIAEYLAALIPRVQERLDEAAPSLAAYVRRALKAARSARAA